MTTEKKLTKVQREVLGLLNEGNFLQGMVRAGFVTGMAVASPTNQVLRLVKPDLFLFFNSEGWLTEPLRKANNGFSFYSLSQAGKTVALSSLKA